MEEFLENIGIEIDQKEKNGFEGLKRVEAVRLIINGDRIPHYLMLYADLIL